jgi:hypothetical protein
MNSIYHNEQILHYLIAVFRIHWFVSSVQRWLPQSLAYVSVLEMRQQPDLAQENTQATLDLKQ